MGCQCMCDVQTCFLASSREGERDVWRIRAKNTVRLHSGCCACSNG